MMIYPEVRLLDSPLMTARERRREIVARMAADLVRFEAAANEQDAIRSLYGAGYPMFDIVSMVGEARTLAFQEIVAQEMAKP